MPAIHLGDALASLATTRDPEAWRAVLDQAGPDIERAAARVAGDADTARDAVQETLLQIRDYAGSFAPRTGDADPGEAARRWITRVAINTTCKMVRSRMRARRRAHAAAQPPTPAPDPADRLEREEERTLVREALMQLPERQSQAILLHHVAGWDFARVAAELRCPLGTAKTHVRRGLERLRRNLRRSGLTLSAAALASGLGQALSAATNPYAGPDLLASPRQPSDFILASRTGIPLMPITALLVSAALVIATTLTVLHRTAAPTSAPAAPIVTTIPGETVPAPRPPPHPLGLDRLDHVIYFVDDLERAKSFYRDTLELPIVFEAPGRMVMVGIGDRFLGLHPSELGGDDVGVGGIMYFAVADIAATVAKLKARKVQTGAINEVPTGRICSIRDSEGNALGLYQAAPAH